MIGLTVLTCLSDKFHIESVRNTLTNDYLMMLTIVTMLTGNTFRNKKLYLNPFSHYMSEDNNNIFDRIILVSLCGVM